MLYDHSKSFFSEIFSAQDVNGGIVALSALTQKRIQSYPEPAKQIHIESNSNLTDKVNAWNEIPVREALKKKLRDYMGIFPKRRTPPFWEPLVQKKKLCLFCILGVKDHFCSSQKNHFLSGIFTTRFGNRGPPPPFSEKFPNNPVFFYEGVPLVFENYWFSPWQAGETIVISSAAGQMGHLVGQIAKYFSQINSKVQIRTS